MGAYAPMKKQRQAVDENGANQTQDPNRSGSVFPVHFMIVSMNPNFAK